MEFKFKHSFCPIERLMSVKEEDIDTIIDTDVTIKGWIRYKRTQQKLIFLHIYDGTHATNLQTIVDEETEFINLDDSVNINVGDTVCLKGKIVKSPAKGQLIELQVKTFEMLGKVVDTKTYLPSVKNITLETLRENQHLRPKFRAIQSTFRIRAKLSELVHRFFSLNKIPHIDPNVITTSDCEGAGEVFSVTSLLKKNVKDVPLVKDSDVIDFTQDFFQKPAFLTVSSQLQLELLCSGLGSVYTTNPSFRAEQSKTKRHLACFTHLEWEIPFLSLHELMNFSEDLVTYCIKNVLEESFLDLTELDSTVSPKLITFLKSLVEKDFERITYDKAIEIIDRDYLILRKKFNKEFKGEPFKAPKWGDDLGSFFEKYLSEDIYGCPVFVYNYPRDLKSFYMKQNEPYEYTVKKDDVETVELRYTVESCDLLIPKLGELIGASIREDNYDKLVWAMEQRKMDISPLEWYVDMRKNATFPHGGAGLGFDRLVAMCTTGHIQDACPFPVFYKHCSV